MAHQGEEFVTILPAALLLAAWLLRRGLRTDKDDIDENEHEVAEPTNSIGTTRD
jgi:hypothetical protein